jgi:hypothetical protein
MTLRDFTAASISIQLCYSRRASPDRLTSVIRTLTESARSSEAGFLGRGAPMLENACRSRKIRMVVRCRGSARARDYWHGGICCEGLL